MSSIAIVGGKNFHAGPQPTYAEMQEHIEREHDAKLASSDCSAPTCEKCGSADIKTRHIKARAMINSSSSKRVESEFIRCREYDYFYQLTAEKEHLHKHCRNCQFQWREAIKQNGKEISHE